MICFVGLLIPVSGWRGVGWRGSRDIKFLKVGDKFILSNLKELCRRFG